MADMAAGGPPSESSSPVKKKSRPSAAHGLREAQEELQRLYAQLERRKPSVDHEGNVEGDAGPGIGNFSLCPFFLLFYRFRRPHPLY